MNKVKYLLVTFSLAACSKSPLSVSVTNNPNFNVEKLFTVEGCSVFRFYDSGKSLYFSNCSGVVQGYRSCGKACTELISIPTTKN